MSSLTVKDPTLLEFAAEVGAAGPVAIEGSRTRWDLGGPLHEDTRLLRAPVGIVQYQPEEMTVKVRAGTTVADLHSELGAHGQRTGLPDRGGTIGGAVVVGENVLEVLGRGSVRNAVLQVRYVAADGQMVTGGGPVVKNVSGFNLPKLMVGALGTLGLVAEVVLRTNPIPESSRWFVSSDADPFDARDAVLRPSAVLWDGTTTWVQLEGHSADVQAEARALEAVGEFVETGAPPSLPPHRWLATPSAIRDLTLEKTGGFIASVGVGTLWAHRGRPPRPVDPVAATVAARAKLLFDPSGRLNPGRRPGEQA